MIYNKPLANTENYSRKSLYPTILMLYQVKKYINILIVHKNTVDIAEFLPSF